MAVGNSKNSRKRGKKRRGGGNKAGKSAEEAKEIREEGQITPLLSVLLSIDPDHLQSEIRYDHVDGWKDPFPHIYGPLNTDAVIDVSPLRPGPDGRFSFPPTGGA